METYGLGSTFLLLIAGCVLTVITLLQMRSGKIELPTWGKGLVSIGMIATVILLLLGMLPPLNISLDNPFISESTLPVVSVDASISPDAAP